jgi:DNA-binding GntR family transcriptional regulator
LDRIEFFINPLRSATMAAKRYRAVREPRTLAGRAVVQIQDLILGGELGPGERLRIEELATTLGMSPMPIREAIQQLETLGFAEHIPHRGARVRELSSADLVDLYSARIPLESLAIRRAARRFDDDDAARARNALDTYTRRYRSGERGGARQAHLEFHLTLYRAAGSHWLLRLIRPLLENGERYRLTTLQLRGPLNSLRREHEDILDACVARDPERAAVALREHLLGTVRLLLPDAQFDGDGATELDGAAFGELELAGLERAGMLDMSED